MNRTTLSLVAVGIPLGYLLAWLIHSVIARKLGRFQGATVKIRFHSAGGRTPGEVHRELWEQKGALDRAVEATAKATVQNNARKLAEAQATPVRGWHAPDAPCEVEG